MEPSFATKVQGLPEGCGFPVQVAIVNGGSSPSGGLTDAELRASPISVDMTFPAELAVTGDFYPLVQAVAVQGTVPVSGTFFQATQPVSIASTVAVSGPLTDTQLRATPVPVSGTFYPATQPVSGNVGITGNVAVTGTFWQATQPVSIGATVNVAGPVTDAQLRASPVPVTGSLSVGGAEVNATARCRANTFRTPGRAGTAGQKLFALHNASGSTKVVHINQLVVDLYQTVVKAVTVPPPIIRIHRFTAVPTNGTSLAKVNKDSSLASNASITAWGDASADGTGSGTTLTVTIPAGSMLTQEFAPRIITAVGYEMMDRAELLSDKDIVLRALEGIVVFLDYTAATQNPVTDMWIVGCDWYEI